MARKARGTPLARSAAVPTTTGFETVYRNHWKLVARMARRYGVAPSDLDDAVQDVFLVLYRRWTERADDEALTAWLRGVAARTSWNYRRSRRRRERWLDVEAEVVDIY